MPNRAPAVPACPLRRKQEMLSLSPRFAAAASFRSPKNFTSSWYSSQVRGGCLPSRSQTIGVIRQHDDRLSQRHRVRLAVPGELRRIGRDQQIGGIQRISLQPTRIQRANEFPLRQRSQQAQGIDDCVGIELLGVDDSRRPPTPELPIQSPIAPAIRRALCAALRPAPDRRPPPAAASPAARRALAA